jgi:eukaryotic-like serine/threonine-protein kinase
MGEVYLAEDTRLTRSFAIKMLPAALAVHSDRRERFDREAQAIAARNHPNIVTVYSVEQAGDTHFLTMEYVDGRTLADLLPRNGGR